MFSIILPNHNEPNLDFMIRKLSRLYPEAQIIVSNDPNGRGKGWAVWQGMTQVVSCPVIFLDADGDISPYEIEKLLPYADKYDIVVGKKQLPENYFRKLLTLLSRLFIRMLFGIKVDTQTGIKLFNYKPDWSCDDWAFDIEILYRAKKFGKTMKEVPVIARISGNKNFKDIWQTLIDSIKIRYSLS